MCHVDNSETRLPEGLNDVVNPAGPINPMPAAMAACTSCHMQRSVLAHAQLETASGLGESCSVCHGSSTDFDVVKMHAGK
jgi:hypothetical protein